MTLDIAQLGQPVLREVATDVTPDQISSTEFQHFIDDMIETMHESKGVGLAAPQVFSTKRLFIAKILPSPDAPGKPVAGVFINPRLSELSEEKETGWEGCLSFLELLVVVPRHRSLLLSYQNRHGHPHQLRLAGFPARVVQHEYDHLDGILTIDRAITTKNIIKASEIDDAKEYL